jgi:hypothetical protein
MDADYRVHLANPAAIQQYNGLKYSDDHSGLDHGTGHLASMNSQKNQHINDGKG